eukprot:359172-Chlamydomonas_euryale.AAC.1
MCHDAAFCPVSMCHDAAFCRVFVSNGFQPATHTARRCWLKATAHHPVWSLRLACSRTNFEPATAAVQLWCSCRWYEIRPATGQPQRAHISMSCGPRRGPMN